MHNYRNPCWEEDLPKQPYDENFFINEDFDFQRELGKSLEQFTKYWKTKLLSGRKERLRCLPYFYILGFAKCGTTDLHDALIKHPQIVDPVIKENQWWAKGRTGKCIFTFKIDGSFFVHH